MKQSFVLKCFVLFASIVFFAFPAAGEPVDGYNSYIELLPGGRARQVANEQIVAHAQDEITRIEAVKRERKIRFLRAIDIVRLTSTYCMVSFEVSHTTKFSSRFSKTPAIFSLLFEAEDPTGLKRYAENYIKWFGPGDIEQYTKSSPSKFCEIFRSAGVEDCVVETIRIAEKKADPKPEPISADLIQSGVVKVRYLDSAVVTENELTEALTAGSVKMSELRETAEGQGETIKMLSEKIKELEGVLTLQTQYARQLEKTIDRQLLETRKLDEKLARQLLETRNLEEKLACRHLEAQKLETSVHSLTALFKGVSRSKKELYFSDINLHIVNGTGRTHGNVNGTGNLIVGYNEKKPGENLRMDSHEIIAPTIVGSVAEGTEKKAPATARILDEIDSKASGVCFIDTARF